MATRRPPASAPTAAAPTEEEAEALHDLGLEIPIDDEEETNDGAPILRVLGANVGEPAEALLAFPEDKRPTVAAVEKWRPMVWMSMRPGQFNAIVNEGGGETRGVVKVKMQPFGLTPGLHPHFYDQFAKDHPPKAPNGPDGNLRVPRNKMLWEQPPEEAMLPKRDARGRKIAKQDRHGRPVLDATGAPVPVLEMQRDCRGLASFKDKITGTTVKTCPLRDCPHHPRPEGIHHSVWMAQTFIARLKREWVIRRFIREYDPRPDVVAFAQKVIDRRKEMEEKERGLGSTPVAAFY